MDFFGRGLNEYLGCFGAASDAACADTLWGLNAPKRRPERIARRISKQTVAPRTGMRSFAVAQDDTVVVLSHRNSVAPHNRPNNHQALLTMTTNRTTQTI